jgi:hypothetical protein
MCLNIGASPPPPEPAEHLGAVFMLLGRGRGGAAQIFFKICEDSTHLRSTTRYTLSFSNVLFSL